MLLGEIKKPFNQKGKTANIELTEGAGKPLSTYLYYCTSHSLKKALPYGYCESHKSTAKIYKIMKTTKNKIQKILNSGVDTEFKGKDTVGKIKSKLVNTLSLDHRGGYDSSYKVFNLEGGETLLIRIADHPAKEEQFLTHENCDYNLSILIGEKTKEITIQTSAPKSDIYHEVVYPNTCFEGNKKFETIKEILQGILSAFQTGIYLKGEKGFWNVEYNYKGLQGWTFRLIDFGNPSPTERKNIIVNLYKNDPNYLVIHSEIVRNIVCLVLKDRNNGKIYPLGYQTQYRDGEFGYKESDFDLFIIKGTSKPSKRFYEYMKSYREQLANENNTDGYIERVDDFLKEWKQANLKTKMDKTKPYFVVINTDLEYKDGFFIPKNKKIIIRYKNKKWVTSGTLEKYRWNKDYTIPPEYFTLIGIVNENNPLYIDLTELHKKCYHIKTKCLTIRKAMGINDLQGINTKGQLTLRGEDFCPYLQDYETFEDYKQRFIDFLSENAENIRNIKYSWNNFVYDFGIEGECETPKGTVIIDYTQLEKLEDRLRTEYFGLIKPTFNNPVMIINDRGSDIFVKSFIGKKSELIFACVARNKNGEFTMVSAHEKMLNNILNKIGKNNVTLVRANLGKHDVLSDKSNANYTVLRIGVPYSYAKKSGTATLQTVDNITENGTLVSQTDKTKIKNNFEISKEMKTKTLGAFSEKDFEFENLLKIWQEIKPHLDADLDEIKLLIDEVKPYYQKESYVTEVCDYFAETCKLFYNQNSKTEQKDKENSLSADKQKRLRLMNMKVAIAAAALKLVPNK